MNRRMTNWTAALILCVLFGLGATVVEARGPSAKDLYKQGQTAEEKNDTATAYQLYYEAFQKDPGNMRYKAASMRLRFPASAEHVQRGERLRAQGDKTGALTEFLRALEIDPANDLARDDIQAMKEKLSTPIHNPETSISGSELKELKDIGGPIQLKPISNEPITLHMTEDSKIVYQTVGKAAGINVLFDPEYTSKRIQVDLANVSLLDALRIIGTVSGTFWRPITPNTIFVAADTRAKRQELQDEAVQTFYLANAAQQNDLNDIQTALRNLLPGAKLYGVPSQNAIVMRATPDELLLAQKIINDLDKAKPEVVIDVALLEVNRDKTRNIGIQLPGSFGIALQPPNATTTTTNNNNTGGATGGTTTPTTTTSGLTLNDLANLNATNFAVSIGAATANLLLSDSDTKVLQNPSIRAVDGQKADLKIGERIPVATGSYQTGAATAIVSSLVNTQFTYLDVGVEIEITPTVHYDGEVTLKIKIVSSQEAGQTTIGGITEPIIAQHTAQQTVRLRPGEVNILGGFLQRQNLLSVSGWPGLSNIPLLKYLFSTRSHEVQDEEIVFMLTPRIVRQPVLSPLNLREIDTGTSSNVQLRLMNQPKSPPPPLPLVSPAPTAPGTSPAPPASPASPSAPAQQPAAGASGESLDITPPANPVKVGTTFKVPINIVGGKDVFSIPMMLHYDSARLSLINVDGGSFLEQGGQAVALVHRDDGHGMLVISASRPPGAAGVNGSGNVCVLTFKATAPGNAPISILRASTRDSGQKATEITGSQTWVRIQ